MSVLAFQPDNKPIVPFNQQPVTNFVDIGPNYFGTMGIPIVRGREFTKAGRDARSARDHHQRSDGAARIPERGSDRPPLLVRSRRRRATSSGSRSSAWSATCGSIGADQEPVPITYAPNTGSPSRAQNLMIRTTGDPMSIAGSVRAALQSLDPGAAGVAAADARRRGGRVADAAPLQHDAADRVCDDRADPRDRRHLRHGRVCGGAADAGDRHPRRARRDEPRDSRTGAVRIAQAGDRRAWASASSRRSA